MVQFPLMVHRAAKNLSHLRSGKEAKGVGEEMSN